MREATRIRACRVSCYQLAYASYDLLRDTRTPQCHFNPVYTYLRIKISIRPDTCAHAGISERSIKFQRDRGLDGSSPRYTYTDPENPPVECHARFLGYRVTRKERVKSPFWMEFWKFQKEVSESRYLSRNCLIAILHRELNRRREVRRRESLLQQESRGRGSRHRQAEDPGVRITN